MDTPLGFLFSPPGLKIKQNRTNSTLLTALLSSSRIQREARPPVPISPLLRRRRKPLSGGPPQLWKKTCPSTGVNGPSSHSASGLFPSGVPTVSGTSGGSEDLGLEAERPGILLKPAQRCHGQCSPGFHVAILGIL